jgi:hypothetical protein
MELLREIMVESVDLRRAENERLDVSWFSDNFCFPVST